MNWLYKNESSRLKNCQNALNALREDSYIRNRALETKLDIIARLDTATDFLVWPLQELINEKAEQLERRDKLLVGKAWRCIHKSLVPIIRQNGNAVFGIYKITTDDFIEIVCLHDDTVEVKLSGKELLCILCVEQLLTNFTPLII